MKPTSYQKNPLVRDGASQKVRLLKALKPDFISIDERKRKDFIRFAKEYSQLIQYYSPDNKRDGDWSEFYSDAEADNPHYALFLSFIHLLGIAQKELNNLTARHLDFYYKEVLQLQEKNAKPDSLHVVFELAKNIKNHKIPKGTTLKAGKDGSGTDLFYQTDSDLVANKAVIGSLKSVFIDQADQSKVYTQSFDELNDLKLKPFGESQMDLVEDERTMSDGQLGFAIASPLLLLKEGQRVVNIELSFRNDKIYSIPDVPEENKANELKDFQIFFSGEKEWIGPFFADAQKIADTELKLSVTISSDLPAILPYDPSKLGGGFKTKHPLVKILLNKNATNFHFGRLHNLRLGFIRLAVDVKGVKNLILQNDHTILDPNKPFQPFGPNPKIGSGFYVGNAEVFGKKLDNFSLNIEWADPPADFSTHYSVYNQELESIPKLSPSNEESDKAESAITNSSFTADFSLLYKKQWVRITLNPLDKLDPYSIQLFGGPSTAYTSIIKTDPGADVERALDCGSASTHPDCYQRILDQPIINRYGHDVNSGFVKLVLTGPQQTPFSAFGHSWFPRLYASKTIELANKETDAVLPLEPYTPVIRSIEINYTSRVNIELSSRDMENNKTYVQNHYEKRVEQFFHIGPFGESERHLHTHPLRFEWFPLVPQFQDVESIIDQDDHVLLREGTLYIGIKDLVPPQSLSVLFQIEEGSADPSYVGQVAISWNYLSNDNWIPFDEKQIVSDTTNLLIQPGIIQFAVPQNATDNNQIMPKGYHWICAQVEQNSRGVGKLLDIRTQAVSATFADNQNDPEHLKVSLPPETIKKLKFKDAAIKSVNQPYPSFGGKVAEHEEEFYTRVSERLRHKNRAINIWDYERMILEKFPSVYKVKCLNHTNQDSEFAPGYVTIVVVSNLRNQHSENPLQPVTSISTLTSIREFLLSTVCPFLADREVAMPSGSIETQQRLIVRNPDFEEVKVSFKVKFHSGYDEGFYLAQLDRDIQGLLSPWVFDEGKDLLFEGRIHKSFILNYVEERPYVDYLTCFKMYMITPDETTGDLDEAVATNSSSILISANSHNISLIQDGEKCTCEDEEVVFNPDEGIGAMYISYDFRVY